MSKRLLLISNSTQHGSGYLDHCEAEINDFLARSNVKRVLFVPYARPSGITHDEYTAMTRQRFERIGFGLDSIHEQQQTPWIPVHEAEAIFIGGGNTFVLLSELYGCNVMEMIRSKVRDGLPYIGASAGSNVAFPTIKTTNDMPIVEVPSLNALGLIGTFQLNPHYIDPDPNSTHKGETRETRIREYLKFNHIPVLGLREGAMLRLEGERLQLKGINGAKLFEMEKEPRDFKSGDSLDFLLQ